MLNRFLSLYFFFLIPFANATFIDNIIMVPNKDFFEKCPYAFNNGHVMISKSLGKEKLRYYFRKVANPKAFLIFFHGSGRSACSNLKDIQPYLGSESINIVALEYPGYGGDKKKPSEKRILPNALIMYDEVAKLNRSNKKLPIILYGQSMGTTIATYVAANRPISGLILRNPPTSVADGAQATTRLPIRWLIRSKFKAKEWAKEVQAPVRIFSNEEDDWVPVEMGKDLYKKFTKSINPAFCSFPYQDLSPREWQGLGKEGWEDRKQKGRASGHLTLHLYKEYQLEVKHFLRGIMQKVRNPKLRYLKKGQRFEPKCSYNLK